MHILTLVSKSLVTLNRLSLHCHCSSFVVHRGMEAMLCVKAAVSKASLNDRAAQQAAVFSCVKMLLSLCCSEHSSPFKHRPIKKKGLFFTISTKTLTFSFLQLYFPSLCLAEWSERGSWPRMLPGDSLSVKLHWHFTLPHLSLTLITSDTLGAELCCSIFIHGFVPIYTTNFCTQLI